MVTPKSFACIPIAALKDFDHPPFQHLQVSMNQNIHQFAIFILVLSVLGGCADNAGVKTVSHDAVAGFHAKYNSRAFASIFRNAHKDFQKSGSDESFIEMMQTVYARLGREKTTRNKSRRTRKLGERYLVSLRQETEFARGQGIETFSFMITGNKAVLVGYKINSGKLRITR